MPFPPQLESALVLKLRRTIPWESSVQTEPPYIDPKLPVDPTAYQLRDRALAFRDLVVGAAVIEAAIQVSDVYNYATDYPVLQGAVFPTLSFHGSNTGQVNSQVRHVLNASIPWDAARFADCDLYGRDALVYEVLARACEQAFTENPVPRIDLSGTLIPGSSAWSLGEAAASRADINSALPLNQSTFKTPDQNLADRDNTVAAYVAQLVQKLKNPFAYALRLYVQVLTNGKVDREPDIYALTSDDGIDRVFQNEPALTGANQIVYNIAHQTLQWTREHVDEVHVPQIYALMIPGISSGQVLQTLPVVPDVKDAQYWRGRAGAVAPNGEQITDISCLPYPYSSGVDGGVNQSSAASLTVPGAIVATLPSVPSGQSRVNVLINPCPVVDIGGSENVSNTGGILGGVDWAVNVASGDITDTIYYVQGGDGIVYNSKTYLAGATFAGEVSFPTYTQAGANASTVRQASVTWNLALPVGTWSLQIEYADLSGDNTGLGVKAEYTVTGQSPVAIAKDIVPFATSGPAGTLQLSRPNFFNVNSPQAFTLAVTWTYGTGQLHVRRLLFTTTAPESLDIEFNARLGTKTAVASFTAVPNQPEVVRFDFAAGNADTDFTMAATALDTPVRIEAIDIQLVGTYSTTPLTAGFQGWRQECVDRAERVVQQGYNQTLFELITNGSVIPTFRDSGSNWSVAATEQWMAFTEVNNPRLREVTKVENITTGRQYQATTTTVYNGGTYLTGDKFYGADGATSVNQFVTQVGAFVRSRPGHLGKPCLMPRGLYYDSGTAAGTSAGTGTSRAYWDTPFSSPTIVACQPWMIEAGLYVAQAEFWMPDMLGADLPLEVLTKAPPMPGQIQVTPNPMFFGTVPSNVTSYMSFDVTNVGGSPFSGTVTVSAGSFAISGTNAYSLATSQHMTVQVAYTSGEPGVADGTVSWDDSAVASFTGGGGAFVSVTAHAVLPACPVYSPTTITSTAPLAGAFGLAFATASRRAFITRTSPAYIPIVSTISDSQITTLDLHLDLINVGMIYVPAHQQLFIIDQVGKYAIANAAGVVLSSFPLNQTSGHIAPSAPPGWYDMAYDSVNDCVVFSPQDSTTVVTVPCANWLTPAATSNNFTGRTWTSHYQYCCFNAAVGLTLFCNRASGTFPYYFFNAANGNISQSSLNLAAFSAVFYVPELNVVVGSATSGKIYIIDALTDTVITSSALAISGSLGGAVFNPCQGTGSGLLYVVIQGNRLHTFDPNGWVETVTSLAYNSSAGICDPHAGAVYLLENSSLIIHKI